MKYSNFNFGYAFAALALTFLTITSAQDIRLPAYAKPIEYDLFLRPVLDVNFNGFLQFEAPGNVTVLVEGLEIKNQIYLNVDGIKINSVEVTDVATGKEIPLLSFAVDDEKKFLIIQTSRYFEIGQRLSVFIDFTSKVLTDDWYGLYWAHYFDPISNTEKSMATTFFQPFGARRMFPCFDEPEYKATFRINVGRFRGYHTLANMDLKRSYDDPEHPLWFWDEFQPTVPMSTYIICIIVSDFEAKEANSTIYPKPVKVWGTQEAIESGGGDFGADMGAVILNWYEQYTGIPYALPKLDSIAIPQFAAGAMENWGLNTYRDLYLIYQAGDSDASKIGVAETLSHEISHQWFGNLATCQWWDQMWLNEGFATFFTYRALVTLLPEFDTEMRYIYLHHQSALRFDSNVNRTHPVIIPTPGFNFFDGTSMEKGGALTRMIEKIFTPTVVQKAFAKYLERHSYLGATQDGFFTATENSLAEAGLSNALPVGVSVKEVFDPWTLTTGYPIVNVRRSGNVLMFTQKNIIQEQPSNLWWVPVKVITAASPEVQNHISDLWIPPTTSTAMYTMESGVGDEDWVLVNPDSAGFYRVMYDSVMFEALKAQLERDHQVFTRFSRAQIMDDYMNFVTLKLVPLEEAVQVTNYITNEVNPGVLISAVRNMRLVINNNKDEAGIEEVKATFISRMESILSRIGEEPSDDNSPLENILRNELLTVLCENDSQMCNAVVRRFFDKAVNNKTLKVPLEKVVPADLQEVVYCEMVKRIGRPAWNLINSALKHEKTSKQYQKLTKALGCSKDPKVLRRATSKLASLKNWPQGVGSTPGHVFQRILLLSILTTASNKTSDFDDNSYKGEKKMPKVPLYNDTQKTLQVDNLFKNLRVHVP